MCSSSSEFAPKPRPLNTYRLTVAYDGTDFFGWQVQPGLPTIQGKLAVAIGEVTGESVLPQGSGRTDTGVHALGQVASLVLQAAIPADRLLRALNRRLPAAIRVTSLVSAPGFHARAKVIDKTYEYRIFERRTHSEKTEHICPPHVARFVWDCRWPLEIGVMQVAAKALTGRHDFTSFAATDPDRTQRLNSEDQPIDNIREIFRSTWERRDGLLVYRVTGSGFLHHMVRNIVGTCVEAGAGRIAPESIATVLEAKDRRVAGLTAPPQGLHLMEVVYGSDAAITDEPQPAVEDVTA